MSTKRSPRTKRSSFKNNTQISTQKSIDNTKVHPKQTKTTENNKSPPKQTPTEDIDIAQGADLDLPNGNSLDEVTNDRLKEATKYRWAVEFLAGPGGYLQKEEIVSDWFSDVIEAKKDALSKAHKEVECYPYSRGRIMKLLVEDNVGTITEISNVKNNVPYR